MKYKDLISENVLLKLISCSFKSPTLNKNVFDFYQVCHRLNTFADNEKMKLCEQYGEMINPGEYKLPIATREQYYEEYNKLIESEISEDIPNLKISESSFDDNNCIYPRDKYLWINAQDIQLILDYIKKQ